ncbi:hypothetical protein [Oleiharenicola lentus]|uniref:hypothetical protein n=1 Tax=Oleiharenicola lentus TaxID=2508720 RepID=UPI003F66781B
MKSPPTQPTCAPAPKQRQCYCRAYNAEFPREPHIPEGYCGICERCGKPGHTQHFPGPVPYTGAWCDRCVKVVAWTWPLKNPIVWFGVVIVFVVLITLLWR